MMESELVVYSVQISSHNGSVFSVTRVIDSVVTSFPMSLAPSTLCRLSMSLVKLELVTKFGTCTDLVVRNEAGSSNRTTRDTFLSP